MVWRPPGRGACHSLGARLTVLAAALATALAATAFTAATTGLAAGGAAGRRARRAAATALRGVRAAADRRRVQPELGARRGHAAHRRQPLLGQVLELRRVDPV